MGLIESPYPNISNVYYLFCMWNDGLVAWLVVGFLFGLWRAAINRSKRSTLMDDVEIKAVIVNKYPPGCYACPLVVIGGEEMCIVTRKIIKDLGTRPKWCPMLIEGSE